MAYSIPDDHPIFLGRNYGMKVLDPVTGREIFNAKYPIFGHDITSEHPMMITHRVVCTNSAVFNEPPLNINFVVDNQWHQEDFVAIKDRRVATIPHHLGRTPLLMVTGSARARRGEKMRYFYREHPSGNILYNTVLLPTPMYSDYVDLAPRLYGVESPIPWPLSVQGMTYHGVPHINTTNSGYFRSEFEIRADTANIYIFATIYGIVLHHSVRAAWGGFDRYMKFWPDLTGNWYQFTFYILPYYRDKDIFIR